MDHDAVPDHPDGAATDDLAVLDIAAGHGAHAGDLVGLADLRVAQHHFPVLGGQHALHGRLDLIDAVIDDAIHPHIHVLAHRAVPGGGVRPDVEAHDDGAGGGSQSNGRTPETGTPGKQKSGRGGQGSRAQTPKSGTERRDKDLEQTWKEISERLQVDLETISRRHGTDAGNLVQELKAVNRETYDYADFLRRYMSLGEVTQVNQDEFDYIYYTYGLSLYGNMPLVEPLEYKEVRRIKEFVIAIDTSGSVSGDLVQRFVTKTYNILRQQENFFTKINLHIIQCDAEVQEDRKITSQKDFDNYLDTMQLHGFGGTDFRPVFQYVDELVRAGEFTNLKGMIYFTDGRGIFPEKKPDYDAAFVFLDDGYDPPDVPVWAIKLVLQSEEI